MGHTIFYDVPNRCVRALSTLECWLLVGGNELEYQHTDETFKKLAILNGTSPTMQLMLTQLALGIIGMVVQHEERVGGKFPGTNIYPIVLQPVRMPAPKRKNQRRHSNDNRTPRTRQRLEEISRFLTRVIRHGQRMDDGPIIGMSPKRRAYLHEVIQHPKMVELSCTEADLHVLANDISDDNKKRLQIVYEGSTASYMIGCYNGHSLPVEDTDDRVLIRRPTYFVHATTWEAAKAILKEGLRAQSRQEIHMVPLQMNTRQQTYVQPSARKTHLLVVDGAIASAAGMTFHKLANDVIVSRGLDGKIPPCCITSIWKNKTSGPQCLNMEAALLAEPVEQETQSMPDYGPPLRIRGCTPSDEPLEESLPVTSKAPPRLTARRTPPRNVTQTSIPEIPPLNKAKQHSPVRSAATSPTPSQLSLPEHERPASWPTSPVLEPRSAALSSPSPGHLNVAPQGHGSMLSSPAIPPTTRESSVGITAFPGFTPSSAGTQFRPPTSDTPCGSHQYPVQHYEQARAAPYAPPAEPTLTLSQVERLIETKMNQFKAPPPPAPVRPRPPMQQDYALYQPVQFAQPTYQHQMTHDYPPPFHGMVHDYQLPQTSMPHHHVPVPQPVMRPLSSSSAEISADIDTICEQIGTTPSTTFEQYVQRIRDFDKHPGLGGWHPRPPPSPLDPFDQSKLPISTQVKNEQNYKSRVRRANINHTKQKDDAWKVPVRKTRESAQVLWVQMLGNFLSFVIVVTFGVQFLWNMSPFRLLAFGDWLSSENDQSPGGTKKLGTYKHSKGKKRERPSHNRLFPGIRTLLMVLINTTDAYMSGELTWGGPGWAKGGISTVVQRESLSMSGELTWDGPGWAKGEISTVVQRETFQVGSGRPHALKIHRTTSDTKKGTSKTNSKIKAIETGHERKKGARWDRMAAALACYRWAYRRRRKNDRHGTQWTANRMGGGVSKDTMIRSAELEKHTLDGRPVALARWANWQGRHAAEIQNDIAHRLMGGMVSDTTKLAYFGLFKKWTAHRSALGKSPFLSNDPKQADSNETEVIAYVVLNLGPLERDVGTVQNHLKAIGYHHKMQYGENPLKTMTRLQYLMKGARREKGPAKRKLPVTTEDLNQVYMSTNWSNPDSVTLWCTISIAWFFMLRMSEYVDKGPADRYGKYGRHPLRMGEIEPLVKGKRTAWSGEVDEISIYISGSKTDWLNQGMVRSHNQIPLTEPNSHLCPVRSLIKLWKLAPSKFQRNTDRVFAAWRSGKSIKADRIVALLRMAVFKQGMNPSAFSLHSLRAGGATALYRATGNIELVARMGRWKTSSISAYLWESHELMHGLGKLMAQGGHTLHRATRDLICLRPRVE